MEALSLNLPISPDEAKPYIVRWWRHQMDYEEPFVTREDAFQFMLTQQETDCFVEGIYFDGILDIDATQKARGYE